jgi:pyruvyltransferase
MRKIKVCFSDRENLGDSINPLIFGKVLGVEFENTDQYNCEITGIGSGLRRFFLDYASMSLSRKIYRKSLSVFYSKPVVLWSAGLTRTPLGTEGLARKNVIPSCVRGELSRKFVEHVLGRSLSDCVAGDAGLLAAELIDCSSERKEFRLGIIPHDSERFEPEYETLLASTPHSKIIDVRGNVISILKEISKCECIVSSSLHGLIVADSLGIPNRRVVLTNKLTGDGFKFNDYYSVFGGQPNPIDLKRNLKVDINVVEREYAISRQQVLDLNGKIKEAFFRYL